jgi:hypothetical protein
MLVLVKFSYFEVGGGNERHLDDWATPVVFSLCVTVMALSDVWHLRRCLELMLLHLFTREKPA